MLYKVNMHHLCDHTLAIEVDQPVSSNQMYLKIEPFHHDNHSKSVHIIDIGNKHELYQISGSLTFI